MKKIIALIALFGLSARSYTYAAQNITLNCAGGGTVTVSNVPDSMSYTDLNASYWCPRGGGTRLVSTGDQNPGPSRITGSLVAVYTQDAINYLYNNGLTKFSTESGFMASNSLRRDEAAAFFARFARDVLGMTPDTSKAECSAFIDASLGHTDLQSEMIAACQLGLFKGYNGKFMPTENLTNAQALTVLVRLIDGTKSETGTHRAINYYNTAQAAGLTASLSADAQANLDINISRGDVAKLIEAGDVYYKNKVEHWGDPHENLNGVTE